MSKIVKFPMEGHSKYINGVGTMNTQKIKNWPINERPQERLITGGPESLSDAQLLAVILRIGNREKSVVDLCREVLKASGGLNQLSQYGISELTSFPGIGPVKASQIKAIMELSVRMNAFKPERKKKILSSQEIFQVYGPYYKNKKREIFKSVLLDSKHRILKDFIISQGSLNQSIVHPREVFKPAIRESAAAIIFIHNHPSGDPSPSREDIETTQRLVEVGELIGIKVLDHIIIGDGSYVSMKDNGDLGKSFS